MMKNKDFFKRYWHYFVTMIGAIILMIVRLLQDQIDSALIWGALALFWLVRLYRAYKRR
ncbi:hypothetical protein GGG87_08690 [Streptococcus sp. zg-86]|uniref:Uncharacterized protein n=1 Tax=Streptococcus zhangguiae TaxID=2664091 RepID=A0A6I4RS62_9STRE|nr:MULTISPECIES: hypothetical protein [unclassified Streptococcus]MTB65071.1 hypothetical protein [Streptococcus sp. zg-86]MTB91242.1 hypothetical protein [Streptococcus sp. zg-36]MWV57015.1 hypothetical protein [Streptococcus sp. zg-70]QTH47563.1 hypothetical protein J5M87_08480 [Streptococcus sp. zg-86]